MATLTEASHISRNAIKYGGIALVVMIVGRFLLVNAYQLYITLNPPKEDPPTYGFGQLPDLIFPELNSSNLTYKLETPTGSLPSFPDRANIYKVINERPNLLAPERATKEADQLGFSQSPEHLSDRLYRWKRNAPISATLEMQVYRGTFSMSVDWSSNSDFLTVKQLPSETKAFDNVIDYLGQANLNYIDIVTAEKRITYQKAYGGELKPTISLSEADFIKINIFRANIEDKYPTVTSDTEKGIIQALVSGNQALGKIVFLEYNYFPVDYERVESYGLITSTQAWDHLKEGKGFVARVDNGIDEVTVRRMGLGYYDTYESQEYLQPVYIFTGDNNFVSYVPAVGARVSNN